MASSTTTAAPAQAEQLVIKGSWEDLLQQAQRLAANQNDEAMPILEKLVQRLSKLPEQQRMANGQRLQAIYADALMTYEAYLTLRDRYDQALALLDRAEAVATEEERAAFRHHRVLILLMAERFPDAFTLQREIATAPQADIGDWGFLVMKYLEHHRDAEAAQTLREAEEWLDHATVQGKVSPEEIDEQRAYLADLQVDLAIQQEAWEEMMRYFEEAAALHPIYREQIHLLYSRLFQADQPALALPYVLQDKAHPVRAGFWHGVALYRLGQTQAATKEWQKVLARDLSKSEEQSFTEYILLLYYLGDEEREGLGNVLHAIQEEQHYEWQTLFLAGLGWAIHDRFDNAETNLQFAVNQRKSHAQGKVLPYQTWTFCRDLLDEAGRTRIAKYFATEK
ncbi:MAG: hypothetical protein R3C14_32820 [Caldilineaceae bacterium]